MIGVGPEPRRTLDALTPDMELAKWCSSGRVVCSGVVWDLSDAR